MKLAKRERIAVLSLLAALAALSVDRFLFPPPSSADASEGPGPAGPAAPVPTSLPAVADLEPTRAAPRLELEGTPNVFDRGRLGEIDLPDVAAVEAVQARALAAEEFAARYALSATILGPHPTALVGDRTLQIGQQLDGFRLEAVRAGVAVFVSDGQRVELRVAPVGTSK